jgi:hypothetical protein
VALALTLAIAVSSCTVAPPSTSGAGSGSTVGPIALGVNIAAWDDIYSVTSATALTDLLHAAGLRLLRYPGGPSGDEYNWSNDTDTSSCTSSVTSSCTVFDPLTFKAVSQKAKAAGASTFVTVNYGSGTPAEAASWVSDVTKLGTAHDVALWEVGNEAYSCYETNQHLAGSPTYVKGYVPQGKVCPATSVMAKSYSANAGPYIDAMKKVSPSARIGIPWAFTGAEAAGAGVSNAATWDSTVLGSLGKDIGFVDAHWYPFDKTAGITDQAILASVSRIPTAAGRIRGALHQYAPDATFVVGETNISERLTDFAFQPVSALFAAATSLEWLVQGAETVDWFDLNNFGSPSKGDYGMVTSGSQEAQPPGSPLPPYYGEQLASKLTTPGTLLVSLVTGKSGLIGFESTLGAKRQVLMVNSNPKASASINPTWFKSGSDLRIETYSASTASSSDPITQTTAVPGHPLSLPPLSVVVASGSPRP